uniref:Uncharacterized protein n=1 Tax=Anguilla anguilla TaxID=7936 RepID=A0A0E9RQI5_ANGAN
MYYKLSKNLQRTVLILIISDMNKLMAP